MIIAVRQLPTSGRNTTLCDGFCLQALLSGAASSFVVSTSKNPHDPFSVEDKAIEFRIEERQACPVVNFKSGQHVFDLPSNKSGESRSLDLVEQMKWQISEGRCLVSRQARISDADMLIVRGKVSSGVRYAARAGFSLFPNTIRADRISIYQKEPATGEFPETFRRTSLRYKPLAPLMLPAPLFGYGFEMSMGWWRVEKKINIDKRYPDKSDWPNFLAKTVGLKLEIGSTNTTSALQGKIAQIVLEDRPPTLAEWEFLDKYYDRVGIGRNTNLQETDFDSALVMLRSPEFPPTARQYKLVRHAAKSHPEKLKELTALYFERLERGVTWPPVLEVDENESINRIAAGANALPKEAFSAYFETLVHLSENGKMQVEAYALLSKLNLFGEKSVPPLLALMKAGFKGGKTFFRENTWQHPYLAGMIGLCKGGKNAASAMPQLLAWINSGEIPMHASYGKLAMTTLIRMGREPEAVWPMFEANGNKVTRKHFDAFVRRATKENPPCHY